MATSPHPSPRWPAALHGVALAAVVLLAPACGGESEPEPAAPEADLPATDPQEPSPPEGQAIYERSLVFVSGPQPQSASAEADSTVVIPWSFRSLTVEDLDIRERGVWLGGVDGWEALAVEADTGQASPASLGPPWRIVPGRRVRMVVAPGDVLEALIFRGEGRELEARPGVVLSEWTRPPREAVRIHRGSAILPADAPSGVPAGVVEGFLADLALPLGSGTAPEADWIFVHGGEALQAVLVERPDPVQEGVHAFRGWVRIGEEEVTWEEVALRWDEVRAYEPARRDVPARWSLHLDPFDPDDEEAPPRLAGYLEAVSSHLTTGPGDGPLLPVQGFFRLRGELVLSGDTTVVTGVARHRQP